MRPRDRKRELRRVWRRRGSRPELGELAYRVYLVGVIALFLAAPAVAFVVDSLSASTVLVSLASPSAPAVVIAVGTAWALLAWLGGTYGPIVLDPTHVVLWAGTDLPRRSGLARTLAARSALLAALAVAGAAVVVGAILRAGLGAFTPTTAAILVVSAGAVGGAGVVAWLGGQVLGSRSWLLAAGLGALTLAVAASLEPGALEGRDSWLAGVALALLSALAVVGAPRLLDRLRGPELLASAVLWRSVVSMARYADIPGAVGSLRALPRRGRRWRAVGGGGAVVRFTVAGLVGAWRTTGRFVAGTVVLAASAGALALAGQVSQGPLIGAVAAVAAYLALGAFCDGLRHASELAVSPAIYGFGRWRSFALHAGAPLVMIMLAGGAGAALATISTTRVELASAALTLDGDPLVLGPALVLPVLLVVRMWAAAKGPLPISLLAPIPTPLGDLSSVNVLAWLSDAPIVSALAGAIVAFNLAAGRPGEAAFLALGLSALLLSGLHGRLTRT